MSVPPPGEPFVIDAFGVRWLLDLDDLEAGLAHRLRTLWERARATPPGPGVDGAAPQRFAVRRDGGRLLVHDDVFEVTDDAVAYAVSKVVTVSSIGRRLGECLLLHAAGVAAPDGRTVALVAPSGTGKTTAAMTLGTVLGYVTDETVAVEADLRVRAYPKPLSVVVDPDAPHDKGESAPDELGLLRAPGELHLAGVVVLDRDPTASVPTLEAIGLVEAAVEVVPQTSALLQMSDPMTALATALARGGGPWRLTYAEIGDCTDLVRSVLGSGEGLDGTRPWSTERGPAADDPLTVLDDPQGSVVDVGPTTVVRRTRWRHALHADGSTLVLAGRLPLGLPGLASTLWRATTRPCTVRDLVTAAVAAHGAHPDAEGVVAETVRGLLAGGAFEPASLEG